ncbi:hypothetical protein G6F35_013304 [Rhizopus arrhizus]|nr:hypothetical protein G6F35_013304 [Rhizopus arrhizus]
MRPARCGSALRSAGRRHRAGRWRARARALPRTGHLTGYRPDRPRPRPAGGCGLGDDLAAAAAVVAGLLHGEDAALDAHLAAAMAHIAGLDLAVFGATAIAVAAFGQGRNLDAALNATHRFFQVQLHHVADGGTATGRARATACTTKDVAEDIAEDIVHVRATRTATTAHAVLERSVAVAVVHAALVAVGQHFVGFLALLEGGFGRRITRVAVRVELHRAATIGLLQLVVGGGAGNAQHFVVIALAHIVNLVPESRDSSKRKSGTRSALASGAPTRRWRPGP